VNVRHGERVADDTGKMGRLALTHDAPIVLG
jgi:hypothetical protein